MQIIRGASFRVEITNAEPGTRLDRATGDDEHMLFVPPGTSVDVSARGERLTVAPDSLVILPSGDCEVVAREAGNLFRIFSRIPAAGERVRVYPLEHVTTGDSFGRIYRSTNLMVNIFEPFAGPRDQTALSPHCHEDFEQGTLTITGRFEHYLRVPWGKDRSAWQPDRIVECGSPSLTIIPAGTIHTTAWLDARSRMIDIFSPPRADFAKWVRNAPDYPS